MSLRNANIATKHLWDQIRGNKGLKRRIAGKVDYHCFKILCRKVENNDYELPDYTLPYYLERFEKECIYRITAVLEEYAEEHLVVWDVPGLSHNLLSYAFSMINFRRIAEVLVKKHLTRAKLVYRGEISVKEYLYETGKPRFIALDPYIKQVLIIGKEVRNAHI